MPKFQVDVYPVMMLRLEDIEASDTLDAITKAIAMVEAKFQDPNKDCRQVPVFTEEFARYVVDPIVGGKFSDEGSVTYLDADHLGADAKDRADGLPVYFCS